MYVCKCFAETPEPQDESCPKHGFPTSKGRACHEAGIHTYDPSTIIGMLVLFTLLCRHSLDFRN